MVRTFNNMVNLGGQSYGKKEVALAVARERVQALM